MKIAVCILLALACAFGCAVWAVEAPPAKDVPALPKTKINPKDGAEMVLIPAGEFLMGTSEDEVTAWLKAHPGDKREAFADEMPQHKVYLDAFYMYKTEVTAAQYWKFCEATGRKWTLPFWGVGDTNPIIGVTWDDAKAYTDWAGVSLPTEAQWEKAARGGDQRVYPWGNAWPPLKGAGNFADQTLKASGEEPWCKYIDGYSDGYIYISPVGSFSVNPYGLYDMAGNVREWCMDWYGKTYYLNTSVKNPTGPPTGEQVKFGDRTINSARVLRGSSFEYDNPQYMRTSVRLCSEPTFCDFTAGFRCAMPALKQ